MELLTSLIIFGVISLFIFWVIRSSQKEQKETDATVQVNSNKEKETAAIFDESTDAINARLDDEYIEQLRESGYTVSKEYKHGSGKYRKSVVIDKTNELIIVNARPIPFGDIINVEIVTEEKNTTVTNSEKSGGIGRAVVGAALAGSVGAVVGATTAKQVGTSITSTNVRYSNVKIFVADIDNPLIDLSVYDDKSFCEGVYSTILAIIAQEQRKK